VRIENSISSTSFGLIGLALIGISRPWMRSSGGRMGFRWRSDAPFFVMNINSSRSSTWLFSSLSNVAQGFELNTNPPGDKDQLRAGSAARRSGAEAVGAIAVNRSSLRHDSRRRWDMISG
jgi:hypothetical protein